MKNLKSFVIIVIVIIVIWLINWIAIINYFDEPNERGTFGDMFGAINSLFSGIAMAGVIIAIIMQRRELELQREELKLTRTELSKTTKANKEQAEIQKLSAEISGITSLLNIMTERIRNPSVKGAAGGLDVSYSPTQLMQFQNSYMNAIEARVKKLSKISISDDEINKNENTIEDEISKET